MSDLLFDQSRFAKIFDGRDDQVLDLSGFLEKGELVGGGSYGDVYQGKWIRSKTESLVPFSQLPAVAVKVMRVPPLRDIKEKEKRLKRIARELKVWQLLRHENILPLVGTVILDEYINVPSLISPWMAHGTAKDFLKAYPDAPVFGILIGVANGLTYLHLFSPCVVHGDLKADNVLVDLRGIPYLCDFGLSRMLEDSTLWKTTASQAGGTLRWTAPELMSGEVAVVTTEGDVYAFAMTSLEIVTQQVPLVEFRNDAAIVAAVSLHDHRPNRPTHDLIDDNLWGLWSSCWAKKSSARPQMTEVVEQMTALGQPMPSQARAPTPSSSEKAHPAVPQAIVLPPIADKRPTTLTQGSQQRDHITSVVHLTRPSSTAEDDISASSSYRHIILRDGHTSGPSPTPQAESANTLAKRNEVSEDELLDDQTFLTYSIHPLKSHSESAMMGKVNCSVPFSARDGRGMVAFGCSEGVWIGLNALRQVLCLKNITKCAVLEDFGIFLVLAEGIFLAYHIAALVPSGQVPARSEPQRLSGGANVEFFTVGQVGDRTLVVYMNKKGANSVFSMLEPVVESSYPERAVTAGVLAGPEALSSKRDFFLIYREFFLPVDAHDVLFLNAEIVVLHSKGFTVMHRDVGHRKAPLDILLTDSI